MNQNLRSKRKSRYRCIGAIDTSSTSATTTSTRRISCRQRKPSCRFGSFLLPNNNNNNNVDNMKRGLRGVRWSTGRRGLIKSTKIAPTDLTTKDNSLQPETDSTEKEVPEPCLCEKTENVFAEESLNRNLPSCQGLEKLNGRLVGCLGVSVDTEVFRVSPRHPFRHFCPTHRHRLKVHHSCPICSIFCSQGDNIYICIKNHLFHKDCAINQTSAAEGKISCPHCNNTQAPIQVKLTIRNNTFISDISRGRENIEIQCVNEVDEAELPEFVYVKSGVVSVRTVKPDHTHSPIHSCRCTNCSSHTQSSSCTVNYSQPAESDTYISECNGFCTCDVRTCPNRVVQKGIRSRLIVFRKRGNEGGSWGVRAGSLIPQGAFVAEVAGEWVPAGPQSDQSSAQFIQLSEGDEMLLDWSQFGNVTRFISNNSSSRPNLYILKVFVEHSDKRFPRLALFAKQNIPAGQELIFHKPCK